MTATLTVLFLITLLALAVCRRGPAWILFLLSAAALLAVGDGPATRFLLAHLEAGFPGAPPAFGRSNIVVLLGGGTERTAGGEVGPTVFGTARIEKAAELYQAARRSGCSCQVLVSGGDPLHNGVTEAALYGASLRALGLPATDVIQESRSQNTWQNAQFTKKLLTERPYDRCLMVTSAWHLRRALLYFSQFGLRPEPVPADREQAVVSIWPSGINFALADVAWHEYVGIGRMWVYNRMGWNKTSP